MTDSTAVTPEVLESYNGLRVTDVVDGLDVAGLQDVTVMSRNIVPVWRDLENFKHRIYGVAHTMRFLPTQRPRWATEGDPDAFFKWMRGWYSELASGPTVSTIKPGEIIVIDSDNCGSVGTSGSNNSQAWINAGAVGVVTNGGVRDTDEQLKQGIPLYSQYLGKGIRPGRVEFGGEQIPVNIGGVRVNPGDVIVADGDGVVLVPAAAAEQVSEYAWRHANGDKEGRRKLFEAAGMELDFTVA